MEPRQGRKSFVRHIILAPFQGSALLSGLTPGLRPGLLSYRPYGAGLEGGANIATVTNGFRNCDRLPRCARKGRSGC